jgi:hypothetical protein
VFALLTPTSQWRVVLCIRVSSLVVGPKSHVVSRGELVPRMVEFLLTAD